VTATDLGLHQFPTDQGRLDRGPGHVRARSHCVRPSQGHHHDRARRVLRSQDPQVPQGPGDHSTPGAT
jgi:hypothetical protein